MNDLSRGLRLQDDIGKLLAYCQGQEWGGYDPYDGLNSRLFQSTPLRYSALARLAWIQGVKRSPINLRPLLGVPKVQNPKGIALFASSAITLARLGLVENTLGHSLAQRLLALRSPGFKSVCWGYPFDWQNRHFMLPRNQPNIISSTFGGEALLDAHEYYGDEQFLTAASGVAEFILTTLNRTTHGETFCFSYTPRDHGQVHNANLLGAAFLARLWSHTKDPALQEEALRSARFTTNRQSTDGSWVYGEAANQGWIDSFHTGYNLMALKQLHNVFQLAWLESSLENGFAFFRRHFFGPGGIVKYYHNCAYPLDIHSIAQAIITLVELADYDSGAISLANSLRAWANREMRAPQGFYYFQKHRCWTIRIPYMRWSQAWMLKALTKLAEGSQRAERAA
jgi:hypothetical protein